MKKKMISLFLSLTMVLGLVPIASAAGTSIAYANTQIVEVDGKPVEFQLYALRDDKGNDTNYVKLRDLAYVLNNTPVSFAVTYDEEADRISLYTELPYSSNGTEMKTPFSGDRRCRTDRVTVQFEYWYLKTMDAIILTDDNGGDYTYFKLRDLGNLLGFEVDWLDERQIITVETGLRTLPQTAVQVPEKADEVITLVNTERAKEGLPPLSTYPALTEAAQIRAAELTGLYSHTRIDGTNYNTVLGETGADYLVFGSGENIANGSLVQNPSGAMAFWMQSDGHRANILSYKFTHIGVACVYLPNNPYRFYWVQVFADVDGTPVGHVQAEPIVLHPERTYFTDPLFRLSADGSNMSGPGGKEDYSFSSKGELYMRTVVDEAWTQAHGAYTVEWSVDDPNVCSIEQAIEQLSVYGYVLLRRLAPGDIKVTCKITGEDGYTAEAYCYITANKK